MILADSGACTILAGNLDFGIRQELEVVHIEEPGECYLAVPHLPVILRKMTDANVVIQSTPSGMTVSETMSEFTMRVEHSEDFSALPAIRCLKADVVCSCP